MKSLRRKFVRENRIYIMPSGRGFLFLSMVVVLILTAATYNNNLIFILAFFLFSIFIVSMLQTHYNVKGVKLEFLHAEEAFEGDRLGLLFQFVLRRARFKHALKIRTRSRQFKTVMNLREDVAAHETVKAARIEVQAWKRGVHALPEVILETHYPLGLFVAWKVFRPKGELLVYPRPETNASPPKGTFAEGQDESGLRTSPDGDFGELKNYLPGESYHQIAWKQYARTGDLYSKVLWGAEYKHYVLAWNPSLTNLEEYLRQMSGWVKQAVEEDASFEMETPDAKIEPGRGAEHARACWRALALVRGVA